MEWEAITESFDATVSEMTADPGGMVVLSRDLIEHVTEGDDDPRFATYVIDSGWSKSRRYWGGDLFDEIASEINSAAQDDPVVGYQGHIPEDLDPYSFPDIQLQWVGAKLLQRGENAKLAVKAYVLPGTKARDYIKRGFGKTVSWRGKVQQEMFKQGGISGVRIKKFRIESIDLSRPRAAGMSARLVGALTSEMETDGGRDEVKPEEIAALQPNELRAHNPNLVATIETEARQTLETQVSEMEETTKKAEPVLNLLPELRKLLHLDENTDDVNVVQSVIAHMRAQGKSLRDSVLKSVLDKKLKGGDEKDRKFVYNLIAAEMKSRDLVLVGDEEKDEHTVSEMVNSIVDSDDDLKETVSEMMAAPPAPPTTERQRGSQRELKPGFKTSTIRVRSARR